MNLFLGTDEGLAVFEGQEEEWRPRYVRLQDRPVTSVVVVEQTLWVGTTGGLWRSANSGATLVPVKTGLSESHVRALAIRPDAPDTLLVGTEPASIFISRNGGHTWTEASDVAQLREEHGWSLPYSPAAGCIRGFAVLGTRVYAAAEVGGVLRSDDVGTTWQLLPGDVHSDVHDVTGHQRYPDVVYAATGGGRYRSRDSGQSWKLIGDGYTRAMWTDPERPEILLAGPARYVGAMGRIERTIDGGDSWTLASDGLRIPMGDMIERFVSAGSHLLAITSEGALYTAKRGVWIWHALDLGVAPVRAAAFSEL
jgi:photosystem II stability/assembly factor-like uncharacterized protein